MYKTHHNNALNASHVGQIVRLTGWVAKRRNFGALVFIDLRDREGITQIVINETLADSVKDVRSEYLLNVEGEVAIRKDPNPKLPTGQIEVIASAIVILNTSDQTPLLIQDDTDALEDTRMKFRYLDLRRPVMQQRLMQRAKIVRTMRNFLDDQGFIDIETPMLTKSTPEGSREYLVPSRVHPGQFYALAQSPQIFKQLLMVAGFERYYQVARCFRDEDLRADRQLDFTQVDIETSFMDEEEFRALMEAMVFEVMTTVLKREVTLPFKTVSFHEAMHVYGSDKPDTRFALPLQDVSAVFAQSVFAPFQSALAHSDGLIKALVYPGGAAMSRKETDALTEVAKKNGAKGLVVVKVINGTLEGSAVKFFSPEEISGLMTTLSLKDQDLVLMTADRFEKACNALGAVRLALRDQFKLADPEAFNFLWVVDFPLFEYDEDNQRFVARHHPFTRPKAEHVHLLRTDPSKVFACAYDLVLNGYEVAGGSMRIYDQSVQQTMFEVIGFTKEQISQRFGFFIDAFKYGTPPHGGIAFGLDRFAMVLTQSDSIRDVIAFPKNASARCPLTDAPTPVDAKQTDELHLQIK